MVGKRVSANGGFRSRAEATAWATNGEYTSGSLVTPGYVGPTSPPAGGAPPAKPEGVGTLPPRSPGRSLRRSQRGWGHYLPARRGGPSGEAGGVGTWSALTVFGALRAPTAALRAAPPQELGRSSVLG